MTTLSKILAAMGQGLADVKLRSLDLREEADLRVTVELLPEWAQFLSLFDDCTDGLPVTALEQRFAAFRKLVQPGGQSPFHYVDVAQQLGYAIDVEDLVEFDPFVAGSFAGEALTNGGWRFTVEIHAPEVTPRFARTGVSVCGEPLVSFGNHLLECSLDEIKPAHVLFLYVFDKPYAGYAPWSVIVPDPVALPLVCPPPMVAGP